MAMRDVEFPFAGRADPTSYTDQPSFTTRSARNVRGRDPTTGRIRGAQRSGLSKYNPSTIASNKIQEMCSVVKDNDLVNYTERASPIVGGDAVEFSLNAPPKTPTEVLRVDRQSNVYVLEQNAQVIKFNSQGAVLFTIPLPAEDEDHVVRALWIDDADFIYVGTSSGGDPTTAAFWCYRQLLDNQFEQVWEVRPDGFCTNLQVFQDKLIVTVDETQNNESYLRSYRRINSSAGPILDWSRKIAFPSNRMDIGPDGSIYTCHEFSEGETATFDLGTTVPRGRLSHPRDETTMPWSEDWTPNDLDNASRRTWSWYKADDIAAVDTGTVEDLLSAQSIIPEDGSEILVWRDSSGNSRHLYNIFSRGASTEFPGPEYAVEGIAGRPCVRFRGNDVGDTPNDGQYLTTLTNPSFTLEDADSQRTSIPAYDTSAAQDSTEGGMFALSMVLRMDFQDDERQCVFEMSNTENSGNTHGLFINRDCGDALNTALIKGRVSNRALAAGGGGGLCGAGTQFNYVQAGPAAGTGARVSEGDEFTGCGILTVIWDGGVNPGTILADGTDGLTHSVFRWNGTPITRTEGEALISKGAFVLGGLLADDNDVEPFRGLIGEIIAFDRQNRTDATPDRTEVLTHDPAAYPSGFNNGQRQFVDEVTQVEGYLAHRWGLQNLLPPETGASRHPYGLTTGVADLVVPVTPAHAGPPNVNDLPGSLGVTGPTAQTTRSDAVQVKYDPNGKIQWAFNRTTQQQQSLPVGDEDDGGIGFGVSVGETGTDASGNSVTDIFNYGPQGKDDAGADSGDSSARKVVDLGASFSAASADGAWLNDATIQEPGFPRGKYPITDSDEFGNFYVPCDSDQFDTVAVVYAKDGTAGAAKIEVTVELDEVVQGKAVQIDPAVPDYDGDATRAANIFVGTDNLDNGDIEQDPVFGYLHRINLVESAAASGQARTLETLLVDGADIVRFDTTTDTVVGAGLLDVNSQFVQCATIFGEAVFVDGVGLPAVYTAKDGTAELLKSNTAGEVPRGAKLVESWRGRLVLARFSDDPHQWHMSALGDIRDWDLFPPVSLSTQAIKGTLARAGQPSDVINTIIPATDDLCLFGGDSTIWRLTGDPLDGGQLDRLSDSIGMTFGRPWAKDPLGRIFFFGQPPGLYLLTPDGNITRLTFHTIEETELDAVDLTQYHIRLLWNNEDRGVHIFQMPYGGSGPIVNHWFWEEKSHSLVQRPPIWTDVFGDSLVQPTAALTIDGDLPNDRKILLGCSDGVVRQWDKDAKSDDTAAIDSFVVIGPLLDPAESREGKIRALRLVLAREQNGLRAEYFASEDPTDLGPVLRANDMRAGRNNDWRERVRGANLFVRLRNAQLDERWAMESLKVDLLLGAQKQVRFT